MIQRVAAASLAQGLSRSRLPTFTEEEIKEIQGNYSTSTALLGRKSDNDIFFLFDVYTGTFSSSVPVITNHPAYLFKPKNYF